MAFSTSDGSTVPAGSLGALVSAVAAGLPADVTPASETADRIGGKNRYETAANVAAAFDGSTTHVNIATGQNYADALTAGIYENPDVAAQDLAASPTLLTRKDALPPETIAALEAAAPDTIRIIGGTEAVSSDVETELEQYGEVERISGADRYETAALLAAGYPTGLPTVYLATGQNFPDALTGAALADSQGAPVLLTRAGELPESTADALEALAPESVVVFGGSAAVSDDVLAAVTEIVPDTSRMSGADRYGTAAAIAAQFPKDVDTAYLATSLDFPDALTGAHLAGSQSVPVLLSRPEALNPTTVEALTGLSPQGVTLLGGTAALSDAVETSINAALPAWFDSLHVQLLSFNDFHGHLEAEDATLSEVQDPEQNIVGGVEYLSTTLANLRTGYQDGHSLTVAAGDLIGGSTFLSGMFHDEPTVEALSAVGLDISSVGNHEFDEGTDELIRMQEGGCHPVDGCYFDGQEYPGAEFNWLTANVVDKETGEPLLAATEVREVDGVKVGFIGMTLEATPTLVSPGGVSTVNFLDEVETANAEAAQLQDEGVEAIVVLLHEGGYQAGTYQDCEGPSGPIVEIAENFDPAIDMVITGHTHQPYICNIPDPDGNTRMVTSAAQYGYVVTGTDLVVSRDTGDVVREAVDSQNHLVLQEEADAAITALLAPWQDLSEQVAGQVVGTITEDITGDASGDRGIETPMANLVADSILWGTSAPEDGGAQISFMNVGGVRASFIYDQVSNGEQPGEITYEESYNVAPFGNLLVSIDMTGDQIERVLEQQFVPDRGRQYLALGVSEGFTYTWDDSQPEGEKVSNMQLNGVPLEADETYRVSTLNFLQEGGDDFTVFTEGTNLVGGPEDLQNLVDYLGANPGLSAPGDRVDGL
ncbi:cell wall-binding repeat-containing protein [Ornithinicoccus hortensis]|nr:cell wall-binding repeat-containing protein [Ornithinicoccus hortensis]